MIKQQILKGVKEGLIEILILNILISSYYFTPLTVLLSVITQFATYFFDNHIAIIILAQIFSFIGLHQLRLFYFIYTFINICFSKNNYFDRAILSIALSLGVYYDNEQPIIYYLIRCLIVQLMVMSLLVLTKLQKAIYYFILVFNPLAACYSLYLNLHAYLIESSNLNNVVIYGTLGLVLTVFLSLFIKYFSVPNIYVRKIFHIPPLILFPIFSYKFPDIFLTALTGTIYLFIILQFLRYYSKSNENLILNKQFKTMWNYMETFLDSRDQHLWVTHISLLVGMSVSYFINTKGIVHTSVILPISDAFAAVVGTKFGRVRIGKKSLEGTLAFIISSILLFYIFNSLSAETIHFQKLSLTIVITSIVELLSLQVDNLLLPLVFSYLYLSI